MTRFETLKSQGKFLRIWARQPDETPQGARALEGDRGDLRPDAFGPRRKGYQGIHGINLLLPR